MPTAINISTATRVPRRQPESRPARTPAAEARPSLESVVRAIRRDCLDQPDRYLDEILVPLGGE